MNAKPAKSKQRADQLLVSRGLCESRDRAQRLIMAGQVRSEEGKVIPKPATQLSVDAEIDIKEECPFVSRGAYKLKAALDNHLPELPPHCVALDIGASTGGFTDLLLQRGAQRVYAVDVGYGQLSQKLRDDDRVASLERVNARYLSYEHIPETVDLIVCDVSFISLQTVLPPAVAFLRSGGWCFPLVKPQFEAKKKDVRKGGVVKDADIQQQCLDKIKRFVETDLTLTLLGDIPSPLQGPAGNQEYILACRKRSEC